MRPAIRFPPQPKTNMQNPSSYNPAGVVTTLMHPPFFVRLFRAVTFPAVVCTRHEFGERYYRSAILGRVIFYGCCLAPFPLIPTLWAVLPALALCLTAGVWFVRCDLQCRHEIKDRKSRNVAVHSYSAGVPRFGLPNDERTNTVVLPLRLSLAGLVSALICFPLGLYMFWAGIGLAAEGWWRKHLAREARLNEQDAELSAGSSTRLPDSGQFASQQVIQSAKRTTQADPLAGFGDVLATPDAAQK